MVLYILLSVFFGWLLILTYYVFKTRNHYLRLVERTGKQKIDEILEQLISNEQKNNVRISEIKKEVNNIIQDSVVYYKKIGLIRFNPFGKSEGEKSFVLSFLDGKNNGLVVNFIYIHDGIRIYAKKVKEGKGEEHPLSEEEKQAVEKAK